MVLKKILKKKEKEVLQPKKPIEKKLIKGFEDIEPSEILKSPHITEKATDLSKSNWYTFKVFPDKNKIQIKRAVEKLYSVNVLAVNIVNIKRKRKRLGRFRGWKSGYKKAIVKIKEGQKIDIMPK